jgi:hypothetical protein
MRRDYFGFVRHAELIEDHRRMLHRRPVRLAAHDDYDERVIFFIFRLHMDTLRPNRPNNPLVQYIGYHRCSRYRLHAVLL